MTIAVGDLTVSEAIKRASFGARQADRPERDDDPVIIPDPLFSGIKVSVVIPTLNEADNLPHVFERMPLGVAEVIVVDGGSTDGTIDVALRSWPSVTIVNQPGKGKGDALRAGFEATNGDVIVMLDGDGSTDPQEIPRFVAALVTGADFAKGTRFMTGGGSEDITRIRRFGNSMLLGLVNHLWRADYSDLCYGYNAFWAKHQAAVTADCNGFEVETLMTIRVTRSKLRVVEVPSYESSRHSGDSNLNAHRDGLRVLRTIIAEWIRPD